MTRAKPRRGGTRGGGSRGRTLPADLTDAAEAALEDLLRDGDDADDDILTMSADGGLEEHTVRRNRVEAEMSESGTMSSSPSGAAGARSARAVSADVEVIDATDAIDEDIDSEQAIAELPVLRVGVFEDATHLRSLQSAVGAAGHVVAIAGSGQSGRQQVLDAVRGGRLDAVIIALPGGEQIIDAALALDLPSASLRAAEAAGDAGPVVAQRPVVIASIEAAPLVAVNRASAAGADLVAVRPHDIGTIAPVMFAANRLTIERRLAADPEPRGLVTYEAFQRILELAIVRAQKLEYPLAIALFAIDFATPPPTGIGGIVRARAGNALVHAIRDIDVATQLDGDRFLVLLPYTDLKRAAALAQKIIATVKAGEPVMSGGRAYPPRVTGAAVAAKLSQPVSFARLLKDAMHTLDLARKDGADLAVQP